MSTSFLLLAVWLGCTPDDAGTIDDTSAIEDPSAPPIQQRDDLVDCATRETVLEEPDDGPQWAQYEAVVVCPGDQLAFDLSFSYAWDGMELIVTDGGVDDLSVSVGFQEPRTPIEPDGDVFVIPRDPYSKTCETARYPIVVTLPETATEAVTFDLLVGAETEDICTGTG